jgi:hypothetical protein
MLALLAARRAEPAFDPAVPQRVLGLGPALFALQRTPPAGPPVVCLHSVVPHPQRVALAVAPGAQLVDLLGGAGVTADGAGAAHVELGPYQVRWLRG